MYIRRPYSMRKRKHLAQKILRESVARGAALRMYYKAKLHKRKRTKLRKRNLIKLRKRQQAKLLKIKRTKLLRNKRIKLLRNKRIKLLRKNRQAKLRKRHQETIGHLIMKKMPILFLKKKRSKRFIRWRLDTRGKPELDIRRSVKIASHWNWATIHNAKRARADSIERKTNKIIKNAQKRLKNNKLKLKRRRRLRRRNALFTFEFHLFYRTIFKKLFKKFYPDVLGQLHVAKFFIRVLPFMAKMTAKRRLFVSYMSMSGLRAAILLLQKKTVLSRRMILLCQSLSYGLFNYKQTYLKFSREIFKRRFLYFKSLSYIMTAALQRIYFSFAVPLTQNIQPKITLTFYGMHYNNITADLILNYIRMKLGQYFLLNDILNPYLRFIKRLTDVLAYKIIVAGRLTRKERAAYITRSYKSISLSTYALKVDYASGHKTMKFGDVGIKIYMVYRAQRYPVYYTLRFANTASREPFKTLTKSFSKTNTSPLQYIQDCYEIIGGTKIKRPCANYVDVYLKRTRRILNDEKIAIPAGERYEIFYHRDLVKSILVPRFLKEMADLGLIGLRQGGGDLSIFF